MQAIEKLLSKVNARRKEVYDWLEGQEKSWELPLYSSVDIRDAGFKVAAVDTNLFPAGFNNLCEHGLEDSVTEIPKAVLERVPHCKNILIVAEEHTRNTWYLENVRILQNIIEKAGFHAVIASFLKVEPPVCENVNYVELETATGNPLRIYCIQKIAKRVETGFMEFDLIIMNNDLTSGIPEILKETKVPIYPSINAGWHSRQKSHHFKHTADLVKEFSDILEVDPWFFSSFNEVVDNVAIDTAGDRERLRDAADRLFQKI